MVQINLTTVHISLKWLPEVVPESLTPFPFPQETARDISPSLTYAQQENPESGFHKS
jgi:hypothetical protein